jgi:hypothetical protein
LGYERFYGDILNLPRVTASSTLTGILVGVPAGNSYTFPALPAGTYNLAAAEQNGTTVCFSKAEATLTVNADEIESGKTSVVKDFTLQRRHGNILVSARERLPEGGSRLVSGVRMEIAWSATVPANVGKSVTSGDRLLSDYNAVIPDILCDAVRIRVTYSGESPTEFEDRLYLSDIPSFGPYAPAHEVYAYR